jgi:hypothetical protein
MNIRKNAVLLFAKVQNNMAAAKEPWRMWARAGLLTLLLLFAPDFAAAHSFKTAVLATSADGGERLRLTMEGFLLATRERDGHPDEESDGHLGGLDVYVIPLSVQDSEEVSRQLAKMDAPVDILLVAGSNDLFDAASALGDIAIVIRPGALPPEKVWKGTTGTDKSNFASRYYAAFGRQPGEAAARGYNAARRIDLAVRKLGGVAERSAIRAGLAETASGFPW